MGATNAARSLKAIAVALLAACAIALCAALPGQAWAAWDGTTVDTTWYNDADTEFTVDTAEELAGFAELANAGNNFAGKKIVLGADIDLSGKTWTPVASFAGEFDGNGKAISNFHIEAVSASGGFFNVIESGAEERVHDLTLSGVTATVGNNRYGTLANSVQGIVNRVTVKNVTVTTTHTGAWVGGMCAFMSWPWMNNCTVENVTINAEGGADIIGGFACILQKNDNMVFDNLDVKGFRAKVIDTDSSGCGVAGFVAQTQRGWEYPKVTNCDVTGIDITASGLVDAAGFIAWPGAHTTAENCTTQGKIDATGVTSADCFAGGFFGNLGWNADLGKMGHVVTNCKADVDITTKVAPAGGFVGSATNSNDASMYATFNNCSASGDVACTSGGTADIGGFAGDADRGVYNDCTASGNVANGGTGSAGQFIGEFRDVTPKYDSRYPEGTRDYLVDEANVTGCTYVGPSSLPFVGNTEEGSDLTVAMYVAQVGDSKFETLQEAVDAAQDGDTVTLLTKVEPTDTITVGKKLTLDLNGNVIDADVDGSYGALYVGTSGNLTIVDSSNGAGMIFNALGHAIGNYGTVTVKGGEVGTGKMEDGYGALYNFYYCAAGSDTPTYGKASIEEGVVRIVLNCGELKVSGGEINTLDNSGSLVITGGLVGDLVDRDGSDAEKVPGAGKIVVSGGAFEEEIDSKHIAEGYELKDTNEGVWIVQPAVQSDPKILEGEGGTWVAGSSEGLAFRCSGEFQLFTGITVDGNAVDKANYEASEGSTVVTLKPAYLSTLSVGQHELVFKYADNTSAAAKFEIKAASGNAGGESDSKSESKSDTLAKTGDAAGMVAAGAGILLVAAGAIALVARRRVA